MPSKAFVLMIAALYSAACVAADEAPKVQPPPLWSGDVSWILLTNSIRVHEGTQPIGAVIAEHDLRFQRSGTLKQSVRLTDGSGAEMILPEGSKAFATQMPPLESGAATQGADTIEWCVIPPQDPGSKPETICIYWQNEQTARYDQYLRPNGFAFLPTTAGRVGMQGGVPQIQEGSVDFGVQFKLHYRLVEFGEQGVTIETFDTDGMHAAGHRREKYNWQDSDKFLYKAGDDLVELTRAADGKGVNVRHVTEPLFGVNTNEVTAVVEVLVGVDGRVKDGRIVKTTGNTDMDAKILDEMKGSWKLVPAKNKKGKPVEKWGQFKVTFKITD